MGGQGFLSSEANLAPELCQTLIRGYVDGDMPRMMAAYHQLIRLFAANQSATGSGRWTKGALKALGRPGWTLRPPLLPLQDDEVKRVDAELRSIDVAELSAELADSGTAAAWSR
jgi:4-hydroxy-tetrahydrodipicolinate synthase